MRRPRSSGITLSALVRTSLIMNADVSGDPVDGSAELYQESRGSSRARENVPARGTTLAPSPNQVEEGLHPPADPVQTRAPGQLGAGGGEQPAPELGRRAEVGPAQLPEEEPRHPTGRRGHHDARGEVHQVRLVAGTGQDIVTVQVAVRDAPG